MTRSLAAILVPGMLVLAGPTHGATASRDCAGLDGWTGDGTVVTAVEVATESPSWPTHCRVLGTIDGTISFELLLPDDWNGKFLMGGGGQFVGSLMNSAQYLSLPQRPASDSGPGSLAGLLFAEEIARLPLSQGYATAGTDTGHSGLPYLADWELDNVKAVEDHAWRAVHRTAEVSKRLISAYYGAGTERSYFLGCSTGGRQGLISAQRFPDDFDGIVAGAPGLDITGIAAWGVQAYQAGVIGTTPGSTGVLTEASTALVHRSIMAKCDAIDGVTDGIIDNPQSCDFDLDSLPVCDSTPSGQCLTIDQLAATRALFTGPPDVGGFRSYPGLPMGSNISLWGSPLASVFFQLAPEYFRYFVFNDPDWDPLRYDLSRWRHDSAEVSELMDAFSTDMREFRDRGGKLILWHGWSDEALSAQNTIDYYEALIADDDLTDEFARLFMFPGVMHCGGGNGPAFGDWTSVIDRWVERDQAPDSVLARRFVAPPPAPREWTIERPVCAYPGVAVYNGSGEPAEAASYSCEVEN